MRYTTNYDIGDRKRGQGINEDSLSVTIFEQGHRDGYLGQTRPPRIRERPETADDEADAEQEASEDVDTTETGGEAGAEPADVAAAIDEAETDAVALADDPERDADGADEDSPEEADTMAANVSDPAGMDENADETDDADAERAEMPANRSAGVFVLADGAGGHDAGDVASYIATTVVAENLAPVAIHAARSHPQEFDIDIPPAVQPETMGPEDIQTGLDITREYDCAALNVPWNMVQGTPFFDDEYYVDGGFDDIDLVEVAHEENRKLNTYTVATWYQAQQLAGAGVDGIIADYPGLLGFEG